MADVRISDLSAAPTSAVVDSALLELSTGSGGNSYALSIGAVKAWFANTFAQVIGSGGAAPAMDGAAAVGSSASAARADHVHPTDASRAKAGANIDITGLSALTSLSCKGTGTFYGLVGGGQNANFGASPPNIVNTGQWTTGWNYSNGYGETNLFVNRGGGSAGGFSVYDQNNAGGNTLLMQLITGVGTYFAIPPGIGSGGTGATTTAGALANLGAAAQDDVRQLMIQIAKLNGKASGYLAGVADDFADQSGVDTANSVNAYFDTTGKLFSNLFAEAAQSLPAMTGASAPSGNTASASSTFSGEAPYLAYDQNTGNDWCSGSGAPQWIQRQTSATITLAGYAITARGDGNYLRTPYTWTFLGSNDGSTWTTLDARTAVVFTQGQRQAFAIPTANRGGYTYHRINVTAVQPGSDAYVSIGELEELQQQTGPLDLRSIAFTASAAPSKVGLFVLVKALSGTITPNTNFTASVTRNGGSTWVQVSLVAAGTVGGFTAYEANGADVTGQSSGTSMKWRLQTTGSLTVQAQAVVEQWS